MNIFLIYAATICISNAFGLALVNFADQSLSREMKEKGYAKVENTMYKTKDTIKNIFLFFVPLYFTIKGIKRIQSPNMDTIRVKVKNGQIYKISDLEEAPKEIKEIDEDISLYASQPLYEAPAKYKAVTSMYTIHQELTNMDEIIASHKEELNISPFVEETKDNKEDIKQIDIIPHILDMDSKKLEALDDSIKELIALKKEKELSLRNNDAA